MKIRAGLVAFASSSVSLALAQSSSGSAKVAAPSGGTTGPANDAGGLTATANLISADGKVTAGKPFKMLRIIQDTDLIGSLSGVVRRTRRDGRNDGRSHLEHLCQRLETACWG